MAICVARCFEMAEGFVSLTLEWAAIMTPRLGGISERSWAFWRVESVVVLGSKFREREGAFDGKPSCGL